jgi:hypothetical protein
MTDKTPGNVAAPPEEDDGAAPAPALDIGYGMVFAALAALALLWLIPAQVGTVSRGSDVSPAFMPQLSAGAVLVLSAMMVVHRLLRHGLAGNGEGPYLLASLGGLAFGAALAMAGLLTVGFVPTAAGLILAGGMLARYRRWHWLLVLAVLFPLVVDYGAWHIFIVDLP